MVVRAVLMFVSVLLFASPALALEVVLDQNGQAGIIVQVDEPAKNADEAGTPLSDLANCTVTIDIQGDGMAEKSVVIPATAPTGGGTSTGQLNFPIANPGNVSGMTGRVYCSDLSGNDSAPFPPDGPLEMPLTVLVPDTLPPGTPLNLIIQVS